MHIRQWADIARPALARCARRRRRELPREGPAGPQARPLHPDCCACPRPGLRRRPTRTLMCLGKFESTGTGRWPRAVRIRKQGGKAHGPGCAGLRCGCWRYLLGPAPRQQQVCSSICAAYACAAAAARASGGRRARASPGPLLQRTHMPRTAPASHEYESSKLAIRAGGRGEQSKGPGGATGHGIELVFAAFEAAAARLVPREQPHESFELVHSALALVG